MERPDLPIISSEEPAAPAPKLRLQANRREAPEMLSQPRGRESMPTARVEIARPEPAEVAAQLEAAARELRALAKDRDEALHQAGELEREIAELRARGGEVEALKQGQAQLQIDNANLKTRVNELETLVRKRETALQNVKDENAVLEKKLEQIKSALS